MNFAKPCLGCFDDGAEEVIVDGETGYLVHDPWDQVELGSALAALLGDPRRSAEMGRRGLERLRAHFTADRFQERVRAEVSAMLGVS